MPTARINNQPATSQPFVDCAVYYTGAGATASLGTTNHVAVFPFNVQVARVVTNITIEVTTSGVAQLYDIGILDTAGNLLAHVGAQTLTNTATATVLALTAPISLSPGTYLLAITGNGTTAKFQCVGGASEVFIYDTATTTTGGVLTSVTLTNTTPTLTNLPAAAQWGSAGQRPLFMLT
jgi:hypothetical protein